MKTKKGIMQSTIAIIIITLISAAALIAFFWQFSDLFTSNVDRGTCRASVELRSGKGLLEEAAKLNIPLRCKTNYYCMTMGGTCPEGYTKIKVNNEEDIKREIAYYMYDCWWMLGEGRLEFWSDSLWKEFGMAKVKSSCMMCSNIVFDDKVYQKYPQIDIISYLQNSYIHNKNITYVEYFTGEKDAVLPTDVKAPAILTDQKYAILFMGIEGDELWEPIKNDLGAIAGSLTFGALTIGPKTTFSAAKGAASLASRTLTIPTGGTSGSTLINALGQAYKTGAATVIKIPYAGWIAAALFVTAQTATTYWNQGIVASYCDGSREGCMNVMMIPYNAFEIGKTCSNIESIP